MKKIFLLLFFVSLFLFSLYLSCHLLFTIFTNINICSILSGNNIGNTNTISTSLATLAIHIGLLSFALFFIWQGNSNKTLKHLGIPGDLSNNVKYSVLGLSLTFTILFVLSAVSTVIGFNDQVKVYEKIASLPIPILVLAVTLAPIAEETFFRGLLVPRFGIFGSALIFGIVHFSYGSITEILGVFAVGLVLAYIYKKSRSLAPCIITHALYNLISVIIIRVMFW